MNRIARIIILIALCSFGTHALAAQLIDLKNQPTQVLQPFAGGVIRGMPSNTNVKEISRYTDNNKVTHIRMQQMYRNYPIWNAHAVVHMATPKVHQNGLSNLLKDTGVKKTANGQLYQQLDADLATAPNSVFDAKQAESATKFAIEDFKSKRNDAQHLIANNSSSKLLVYVDKKQLAHWAFKVTFSVPPSARGKLPAQPVYILDATTFKIYKQWDDVMTEATDGYVPGGGFGGNEKNKLVYDGLAGHLASFIIKREAGICYLQNEESVIMDDATKTVMHFPCEKSDSEHNQLYWSGDFDRVNGGYSPANDAIFAAQVVKQLYKTWYNIPVLINEDGTEMMLHMNMHVEKMDNAFWYNNEMTFGDGQELYPLTSLGIAAHEVSHGFTQQHSNLVYEGESGGMNEAFSDMAAQTAEYFAFGKSSWLIGSEVFKIGDEPLRYMDQPSKNCYGKEPGTFCSIDNANQNYDGLNVHFSSGVYNRAFYLLSTTPDWNPRKAFNVMMHANASYWLPESGFADGAACAVKAAEDLHLDKKAVEEAFKAVGIVVPERCTNSN